MANKKSPGGRSGAVNKNNFAGSGSYFMLRIIPSKKAHKAE
jgi:hypothetical protein